MKLITEIQIHDPLKLIIEGEGEQKKHYLTGLMLEFDGKNKNGRIYRSEWHDPCVIKYISEKINENRAMGELDHPDGATINLTNVSHRIVEMHKDGSNWVGKSIISNEGNGRKVLGLLDIGCVLGSSSRGVGSLKSIDESLMEVQSDYKLITPSDIVSDPSAHGALMQGILENVDFFYDDNGVLAERSTNLKKKLKKMSLKEIEEKKVVMFEEFMKGLTL